MAANPRTPFKQSRRAGRQDMKSEFKYAMEEDALRPITKTAYVADAQRLVDSAVWLQIIADPAVVQAHDAWKATVPGGTDYDAITNLLNCISRAYIVHAVGSTDASTPAVVYTTPHTRMPDGDYLHVLAKADFVAQMAFLYALDAVLTVTVPSPPGLRWARILGIAEAKPNPERRRGQFLWYLSSLKRYRVDLDTVHGFQVQGSQLYLSSLNACGAWLSETSKLGELDRWVAHIVLLYHSNRTRDPSMTLLDPAGVVDYDRWTLSLPQEHAADSNEEESVTIAPYNASHAPGRMTWLGFQLVQDPSISAFDSLYQKHPTGFLKISWQDTRSVFKECQLLKVAHGITRPGTVEGSIIDASCEQSFMLSDVEWLPGLTRFWPRSTRRDALEDSIGHNLLGMGVRRVKEVIHLASVGQPLSQCASSSDLLNVIFDAIGTHSRMLRRGLLHRDMSWYNVLCRPWHHEATGDKLEDDYPSAEYVLTGTKSPPCSLIVDLDHSALTKVLHSPEYQHRKERTGTPMFTAIELSTESVVRYDYDRAVLKRLIRKLGTIEDDKDLFGRAFPDYDGCFMTDLQTVLDLEMDREEQASTSPSVLHMPRHDIESLYWILLWGLARACPKECDPNGADIPSPYSLAYSRMVNNMLGESAKDVSARLPFMIGLVDCAKLFHPKLADVTDLVVDIARYLSVPWHLYDHIMQEDHAHIAVQRLILLHQRDKTKANVPFDTSQPRTAYTIESSTNARSTRPGTGLLSASDANCISLMNEQTIPRGVKRGGEDIPSTSTKTNHLFTKRYREQADAASRVERELTVAGYIEAIIRDRLWFGSCVRLTTQARNDAGADADMGAAADAVADTAAVADTGADQDEDADAADLYEETRVDAEL